MADTQKPSPSLGMSMMMKALGINPDEIIATVQGYGETINGFAKQLNAQDTWLRNIDDKLNVIVQWINAQETERGKDTIPDGSGTGAGAGNVNGSGGNHIA